MIYKVENAFPPDIVCRLIVRRNEEVDSENELWRKGAVLHFRKGAATACIIEDARNITVLVKGQNKSEYIAELRDTLSSIFESYKELRPELLYEVLIPEGQQMNSSFPGREHAPLMLPEATIAAHTATQNPYFDPTTANFFSLFTTAMGYFIQQNRLPSNVFNFNAPVNFTFNKTEIQDCTIDLQGELRNIANSLKRKGFENDADDILAAAEAAEELDKIISEAPTETSAEEKIKKSGVFSALKDFYEKVTDENSDLRKNAAKLHNGMKFLQKAGKAYNSVAKFIPMLSQMLIPDAILNLGSENDD